MRLNRLCREPSDEIIKADKSFSTNTTYTLADSILITFPIVAKVPGYSAGKGIYELKNNLQAFKNSKVI